MSERMSIVGGASPVPDRVALDVAPGLHLYKFVKKDSWKGALTADRTGEVLPHTGSAWIYEKQVLISPGIRRAGVSSDEIGKAVRERGYFVFPISDDV